MAAQAGAERAEAASIGSSTLRSTCLRARRGASQLAEFNRMLEVYALAVGVCDSA